MPTPKQAQWQAEQHRKARKKYEAKRKARNKKGIAKAKEKRLGLSPKEELFVHYYLASKSLNAVNAAVQAGYSPQSAKAAATRLMAKKGVQEMIAVEMKRRMSRVDLTADIVLQELAYAVARDPLDLADADGVIRLKDLRELPTKIRHCIESIKTKRSVDRAGVEFIEVEVKLTSKMQALELAMRHFGLLNDKLQVSSADAWAQSLLRLEGAGELDGVVDGSFIEDEAEND